jgi:hypothetical protein
MYVPPDIVEIVAAQCVHFVNINIVIIYEMELWIFAKLCRVLFPDVWMEGVTRYIFDIELLQWSINVKKFL